jgi:hypothetical protein
LTSPTARSLAHLRRRGFIVAVVERWLPHAGKRADVWGFGDLLAAHPRDGVVLLVQTTTAGHLAHRLAKAKRRPELALWLRAGGRFEVHGWQQHDGRSRVRRVEVVGADLAEVVLAAPRRRRKGERQRDCSPDGRLAPVLGARLGRALPGRGAWKQDSV